MKRVFALMVILALLLCTSCSADAPQVTEPIETTEATQAPVVITEEVKAELDAVLEQNEYEGIVHLTHNGVTVYEWVKGTNDLGEPLSIESPMHIASNSKQFCAAAILMLRDQGKLSLEDTLEKYFPEYTVGKDITLHQMLSMQSGIPRDPYPMLRQLEQYMDNSAEENLVVLKEWTFSQPLNFDPGTQFEYSNLNYTLLSFVVEQVSGLSYHEFIRSNIFEPLGMTHSGFDEDVWNNAEWTKGLTFDNVIPEGWLRGISQGAGDITSTAGDLEIWMNALQNGQVVSEESFREMTTEHIQGYGYGLEPGTRGGWGHGGSLPHYTSQTYFNQEYGYNFFIATGKTPPLLRSQTMLTASAFLTTLYRAMDAAAV